jgi:UDP-N-acetylglucosamine acyltransferase
MCKRNVIHETAIIGPDVVLGTGNEIGPYTVIMGKTIIGNDNYIGAHTAIGVPPTDTKRTHLDILDPHVEIGNNNFIREFSVVEQPCYEALSRIGNNCYLMQSAHLSHDNILQDDVVITNQCVLGGIVKILRGANLGMGCTINQYTIVGQYSIVATGAPCMKNVKPFSRYIPNQSLSVNKYALKKYGLMDYLDEISEYVLENVPPKSACILDIVSEFDYWVKLYGHSTYGVVSDESYKTWK